MVHRTYITAHWSSLTYAFERTFSCGSVVHSKITCTVSGASGCCWPIVTIQGSTYTDHRGRSPVQESLQLKDTRCCHYHRNCLVDWKVAPTGSRGSWNETFLVLSIGDWMRDLDLLGSSFITRLLDSMWKVQMTKRTTMNYWWLLLSFSHLNGWAAADTVRTLICCSVCKGWQTPCVYSSVQNSCFL
jgi:hypothetical protein